MNLPNWNRDSSFFAEFTGRDRELAALARELAALGPRTVSITGAYGIGKTMLAKIFASRHTGAFPGGTHHVHATRFESWVDAISACTSASAPNLLILDDLDALQPEQEPFDLAKFRRLNPTSMLICIARRPVWIGVPDLEIKLGGLSDTDIRTILSRWGHSTDEMSGITELVDRLGRSPLLATSLIDLMSTQWRSPRELLSYLSSFSYAGLVGPEGSPLASGTRQERQIVADVSIVSDDLLRQVYEKPQVLYEITPRRFEEFVAEMLDRLGYQVTLTPPSCDGGKDIYAAKKDDLGSFLYVVECKKYAPDNPVGVGLIRQLNGVVQAERATAGILATTSYFTRGAKELQSRISHQISLKDYVGIREWLKRIFESRV
jgi:restriction system protein